MTSSIQNISEQKKEIIKNLYLSSIPEGIIASQLDLEVPVVIDILKDLEAYKEKEEEKG